MVHAENYEMIRWLTDRLLEAGAYQAKYHAISHAALAEGEATGRVIALSELMDVPILVVHVSTEQAAAAIRSARDRGLRIYRRDLPPVLLPHRRRPRPSGGGRDEVLLQPAAPRRGGPRGDVAGGRERHLPGRLLRPRSLPLRLLGQARPRDGPGLQARGQRDPRYRGPAAAPLQRRGRRGPDRPPALRRALVHERGPPLRPRRPQGEHQGRGRRGPRDLGPGAGGHHHHRHAPRQHGLHPLRGPPGQGLAGLRDEPGPGGGGGRRAEGGAGGAASSCRASCRASPSPSEGACGRWTPAATSGRG